MLEAITQFLNDHHSMFANNEWPKYEIAVEYMVGGDTLVVTSIKLTCKSGFEDDKTT